MFAIDADRAKIQAAIAEVEPKVLAPTGHITTGAVVAAHVMLKMTNPALYKLVLEVVEEHGWRKL